MDGAIVHSEVIEALMAAESHRAKSAEQFVPARPGLYAIFIDNPQLLPPPFCNLSARTIGNRLIYIGVATVSLLERLVRQDLRHASPSTFFRGLGALLSYRPRAGSLAKQKRKNNYRFEPTDTASIIAWINTHLSIRWLETPISLEIERVAIPQFNPILNTMHNSAPVQELARLRKECRRIAAGDGCGVAQPGVPADVHASASLRRGRG
jgi:hypothetical protein